MNNIFKIKGSAARLPNRDIKIFNGNPVMVSQKLSISNGRKEAVRQDILNLMNVINRNVELWDNDNPFVQSGHMFNGSCQYLMSPEQTHIENLKSEFGDIDIIVPQKKLKDLEVFLDNKDDDNLDWKPSDVTKFTSEFYYMGRSKGGGIPDQTVTLWFYMPQNIIVQIDFEGDIGMTIVNGVYHPSQWIKFSKDSPLEDLKNGIKGMAGALLLRSLARVTTEIKNGVVLTPTGVKRFSSYQPIESKHVSKSDQHSVLCEYTLNTGGSGQGMRKAYRLVGTLPDGRCAYEFIEASVARELGGEYQPFTNLSKIFQIIFKKIPTGGELLKMRSFILLLTMMKEHLESSVTVKTINRFNDLISSEILTDSERKSINSAIEKIFRPY